MKRSALRLLPHSLIVLIYPAPNEQSDNKKAQRALPKASNENERDDNDDSGDEPGHFVGPLFYLSAMLFPIMAAHGLNGMFRTPRPSWLVRVLTKVSFIA